MPFQQANLLLGLGSQRQRGVGQQGRGTNQSKGTNAGGTKTKAGGHLPEGTNGGETNEESNMGCCWTLVVVVTISSLYFASLD